VKSLPVAWKTAVAGLALAVAGAFVAVKILFPEPKVRAWIVDAARRRLGRDVRLERIDVGLTGLSLRGLEVSERPDFSTGTFVRVEKFRLRPSWRELLKRRLVVEAVAADGFQARVVKGADGRYNYETLGQPIATVAPPMAPRAATKPAARKPEAQASAPQAPAAASSYELDVRRASISGGGVEYVDGRSGTAWSLSGLTLDATNLGGASPFGISMSFRAAGKAGGRPVDIGASFSGTVDPTGGGRGKLKADFKRFSLSSGSRELISGAVAARMGESSEIEVDADLASPSLTDKDLPFPGVPEGLRLPPSRWTASASYSPTSIRLKSLRLRTAKSDVEASGKVAGGAFDLSVKSSALALDEVGQLTPKAREEKLGGSASFSLEATGTTTSTAAPVATRGRLDIATLTVPNATATGVAIDWDLRGAAADLRGLNGAAKLRVGGGKIGPAGDLAPRSKFVKVLLYPLLIVQKISRVGGVALFPDLNNIALNKIVGDYAFKNGVMTLNESEIDSSAARVTAKGTIDLAAEALNLVVTAQVAKIPPVEVSVTGTFDKPKPKVDVAKLLQSQPVQQLLKRLFH
jgi:hypothetical protein